MLEDFAKAKPKKEMFPEEKFAKAEILEANYFANSILINNGNFNFTINEMPWQAQLSPYRDAVVVDANND